MFGRSKKPTPIPNYNPLDVPAAINDAFVNRLVEEHGPCPTRDDAVSPKELVMPFAQKFLEWLNSDGAQDTTGDFIRPFMDKKTLEKIPTTAAVITMAAMIRYCEAELGFSQTDINRCLKTLAFTNGGVE